VSTVTDPAHADPYGVLETVWRMESARIVAGVARVVRDVGQAEELAHDALVAAMEQWPREGVPDNPGAWLAATARRRAIDAIRREQTLARKTELLESSESGVAPAADVAVGDGAAGVGDDLLALLFATCHPAVARESRVALTLRLFGGLTTDEIAHAFLVPSPTVGQRISRAKKRLAAVGPEALAVPTGDELAARLGAVLEVVYLVFNEGYAATTGVDWTRPALCVEAMRLGRVLAGLQPDEPEVHGLVALMELQASRLRARVGPSGEPVLLGDQDRARWDRVLLQRGLAALARAEAGSGGARGRYTLQAAIAACHARARSTDDTDWAAIAALYGELAELTPSPVVELNRAVAVSRAEGPEAGLAVLEPLRTDPALAGYHLLPAVRADMLTALGRIDEAVGELDRALALVRTAAERELLERRRCALAGS
jgi:RNA polymerase sigma factor (sigma-70 family)